MFILATLKNRRTDCKQSWQQRRKSSRRSKMPSLHESDVQSVANDICLFDIDRYWNQNVCYCDMLRLHQ